MTVLWMIFCTISLKDLEKPVFEIEKMENPLGELNFLNSVGQILDSAVVVGNPMILGSVEAAVSYEGTNGFHLAGIKPDAVIAADINHYPRDLLEILFRHRGTATDAGQIGGFGLQGGAMVTSG